MLTGTNVSHESGRRASRAWLCLRSAANRPRLRDIGFFNVPSAPGQISQRESLGLTQFLDDAALLEAGQVLNKDASFEMVHFVLYTHC